MRPRLRFRPGALPAGALLCVSLAAWLLSACAAERHVLAVDETAHREVALLVGTALPEEPPAPEFARLTPEQVAASLRRVVVRPSTWISFIRKDPEPLLSPQEVRWATVPIAERLPGLPPDQRLQLRFRDRFHGYRVEVEVYAEGHQLVYRFTQLADQPDSVAEQPKVNPVRYARLEPQPGQSEEHTRDAEILRDPIFAGAAPDTSLTARLALLDAAAARGLSAEALAPARAALQAHPELALEALRTYLEKLDVLLQAQEKGLFPAEEAPARQRALLDELTRSAGAPPTQ